MISLLSAVVSRVVDEDTANCSGRDGEELSSVLPRYVTLPDETNECLVYELGGLKCVPVTFAQHCNLGDAVQIGEHCCCQPVSRSGNSVLYVVEYSRDFHSEPSIPPLRQGRKHELILERMSRGGEI